MGKKGGMVRSEKKKEAARLREMKKRELSNQDLEWIHLKIIDPKASALEIRIFIELIRDKVFERDGTIKEKIKVLNLMFRWHELWHGRR